MAETIKYSIYFIIIGAVTGIAGFIQCYMFNVAAIRLTSRVRITTFGSMLKQEIGWFDDAKNSVGALCARLSGDAAGIQGASGTWVRTFNFLLPTLLRKYYKNGLFNYDISFLFR